MSDVLVPLTVPQNKRQHYADRYQQVTQKTGRFFVFAADHKIEHLNGDFCGEGISQEAADPEHLFRIAAQGRVNAFATHLGLIARYGERYREVPYLVKMNGKTNLLKPAVSDPVSAKLWCVDDIVKFAADSGLDIVGVGFTLYLGSEFEAQMLSQAARMIVDAHREGLLATLWVYPRGESVEDTSSESVIAGAAGVAHSLGADFVKVQPPRGGAMALKQAVKAAGNTGVICAGGATKGLSVLFEQLHSQLEQAGTRGCAIGRNIYQRSLSEAVAVCEAIRAILYGGASAARALELCQ